MLKSKYIQFSIWPSLILLYAYLFSDNHPSLTLNLISTTILVTMSAVIINLNHFVFNSKFKGRHDLYFMSLLLTLLFITLMTVVSIEFIYDVLHGSDDRRFGFWTNFKLDFAWIVLHLISALIIVHGYKKIISLTRKSN